MGLEGAGGCEGMGGRFVGLVARGPGFLGTSGLRSSPLSGTVWVSGFIATHRIAGSEMVEAGGRCSWRLKDNAAKVISQTIER